jgi:hypothetical protein
MRIARIIVGLGFAAISAGPGVAAPVFSMDTPLAQPGPFSQFVSIVSPLERHSAALAGLPVEGSIEQSPGGAITLNGNGTGINLFEISAAQLDGATALTVSVPAGAKSVVRVAGPLTLPENLGLSASNPVTGLVDVVHSGFDSSQAEIARLAPITILHTGREGTLFANAINDGAMGFAASHYYVYPRLAVPEPPSIMLLLVGAVMLCSIIVRRRNSA